MEQLTLEQLKSYKFHGIRGIMTIKIIERFKKSSIGEIVTYKELEALCDAKSIAEIRGCVDSAKRYLEIAEQQSWGTIIKTGYKRLTDIEKITKSECYLKRSQSDLKRSEKNLAIIDVSRLDDPSIGKYNMLSGVISAIKSVSKPLFAPRKISNNGLISLPA